MEERNRTTYLQRVKNDAVQKAQIDADMLHERIVFDETIIKPAIEKNGQSLLQTKEIEPTLDLINEIKREIEQDAQQKLDIETHFYGNFGYSSDWYKRNGERLSLGFIRSVPLSILQELVDTEHLNDLPSEIVLSFQKKFHDESGILFVARFRKEGIVLSKEGVEDFSTGKWDVRLGFGNEADPTEYGFDKYTLRGDVETPANIAREYLSRDIIKFKRYFWYYHRDESWEK